MPKKGTHGDMAGTPSEEHEQLRQRAEALAKQKRSIPHEKGDSNVAALNHELSVHQIELELQNEELQRAHLEAEEARQKYYDLYDRAPVAYVTLNPRGTLVEMNLAAATLLDRPRGALRGCTLHQFVAPRDIRALDDFLRKTFASQLVNACEVSLVKEGAPTARVHIEGFQADPGSGNSPLCRAVMFDITERKRAEVALQASEEALRRANAELEQKVAERTAQLARSVDSLQSEVRQRIRSETALAAAHEELRARASRLRDLAGDITRAVQRERQRIATVLHEEVQQLLAAIRLRASLFTRDERESIQQGAAEILALLDQCFATSRSLTTELHPPVLQLEGLAPAVKWIARWMGEKHGLRIDVTEEGVIPPPAEDVKILVFEAARELLFNVVKHAQVDSATVFLRCAADHCVQLTVTDAGRGFEPQELAPAGKERSGFGLFSIRERVGLVGGSLEIVTAPGQGSRCTLTVPLVPAAAAAVPSPAALAPAAACAPGARSERIRTLLVDDHAVVRAGIAGLLAEEPDVEVVGQGGDGREAVELADRLRPDVILMDIRMPGLDGIEATRAIRSAHPEVRIIGLSMYNDAEHVHVMRAAGAETCLSKSGEVKDLLAAIRSCRPGGPAAGPAGASGAADRPGEENA